MAPPVVMIIRHAEKPADDGSAPFGVDPDGNQSKHDLIVRGWQRAGSLARLFVPCPADEPIRQGLTQPSLIYAAAPAKDGGSGKGNRSVETVSVVAAMLGTSTNEQFGPADTKAAAESMLAQSEPVLAAWEHHNIQDLVRHVTAKQIEAPAWPGERFDMVFVLTQDDGTWNLQQVAQMLLPDDSPALFT